MDVRESLLKAATKVFAEAGVRGATTRRIAQEAGVNEVTLFRHFRTKDELIDAALQHFARQAQLRELPADPVDPEAELLEWCRTHYRDIHRFRALIRKTMGAYEEHPQFCAHGMQASIRIWQEVSDYLRRLKRKGLATAEFDERVAANMLMGTLFADAMGRDTKPEQYPYPMRDAVDRYVQLLLDAIGVARPARTDRAAAAAAGSKTSEK
jgi:AcrR family transcriptional regulator